MINSLRLIADDRSTIESMDKADKSVFENAPWGIASLSENIDNSYDTVISAVNDSSEVLGYVILRILGDAEILRIGVIKEYRRKGIAAMLMKRVFEAAVEKNADRILLEVRKENTAAISLYRSFGFKTIAVRKDYYTKPIDDALIMESVIEGVN